MNPLSILETLQPINWPTFALVSTRVVGLMVVAPLWSMTAIPAKLRGAMAIVVTLTLLPMSQRAALSADTAGMVVPMVTEFILGIAIGLSAAMFLHGVAVAAEVVSLQMGLSLGVALGGMADVGSPGIGQLEGQFTLAVYVAVGGHLALLHALANSLQSIPPGAPINLAEGGRALVAMAGSIFTVAVQVAAPMMVALLVTNLALAVLNRAVPQLNTMMVAVPVTVAVGFIALGATLPYAASLLGGWAGSVGRNADQLVQAFTPVLARP
ncbi:MAG: flagellar biosynthetic protein FliR [Gemmatimonadota bacterium]